MTKACDGCRYEQYYFSLPTRERRRLHRRRRRRIQVEPIRSVQRHRGAARLPQAGPSIRKHPARVLLTETQAYGRTSVCFVTQLEP
jgi:hypothetical protein